ncbi:MAG: phospholipase A [Colwellia sp.]|nr:phospholipase A [Colwellia sp.]
MCITIGSISQVTYAADDNNINECLLSELKASAQHVTVKQLYLLCEKKLSEQQAVNKPVKLGVISRRIIQERKTEFDPYVLTPHKMNYILPVLTTDKINRSAYEDFGDWSEHIEEVEAKFQISLKVPLNNNDLFVKGDGLFFGFTLKSWWQIYSDNISKPFRETNYQPEVFYLAPLDWHPLGGNTGLIVGFEHQSNGRSQLISRSWNRAYLNFLYEKDNFALSFRPWFRLSEDAKEDELSAEGDDNPDIGDYMGHFELSAIYKTSDYEFSIQGRQNFSEHHGGLELGVTFPLWGKLRGYVQFTKGYGESLIDYNHDQQRFGLGVALTNIL